MDTDVVLPLVVRWLEAPDAIKASCACREWRATLSPNREGGDLWKQVCLNTRPSLVHATGVPDYRRLALGLLRDEIPSRPAMSFTPTLQYDDLFAVVDLYRTLIIDGKKRKEFIASWTSSVGSDINMSGNEEKVVLRGLNPYSESFVNDGGRDDIRRDWMKPKPDDCDTLPHYFAWSDAFGSYEWWDERFPQKVLRVRTTLFRRDTMQSVCILDEATTPRGDEEEWVGVWEQGVPIRLGWGNTERLHSSQDRSGYTAQAMMQNRGITGLSVVAKVALAPILPRSGSDDEPRWLSNVRRASMQNEQYEPSNGDLRALSTIPFFDFEVSSISIRFHINIPPDDCFNDVFDSLDDQMIAVEGLCWK